MLAAQCSHLDVDRSEEGGVGPRELDLAADAAGGDAETGYRVGPVRLQPHAHLTLGLEAQVAAATGRLGLECGLGDTAFRDMAKPLEEDALTQFPEVADGHTLVWYPRRPVGPVLLVDFNRILDCRVRHRSTLLSTRG